MKTIVIGDIHGRTIWENIVKNNTFNKVVFLGDYFDTHDNISPTLQLANFKNILEFKRNNIDKVVLLIGNHCYHYMRGISEKYSGYQAMNRIDFQIYLEQALKENLIQLCYLQDNIIFSHAGFTKTWCKVNLGNDIINKETFQQSVNDLFTYSPKAFRFTIGRNFSNTGDDICQSPIWVRPNSLINDKIDNFIQVVGHTQVEKIENYFDIWFIDTLGISGECLLIENNKFSILKNEKNI